MPKKIHSLTHTYPVTSLKIGQHTGRLMASSDTNSLNVWAIGKTTPILKLSSPNSSCIALDWNEEIIVAGNHNGSLKLWDLETEKVIRNLIGHNHTTSCVEFHPFGDFFASVSQNQIKLWDLRRKGCIQTYNSSSETDVISCLKITPDGRWIGTGSNQGFVNLWDMTAGKLVKSFPQDQGSILSLQFSPSEVIMVTLDADSFNVVDLQTFDHVKLPLRKPNEQSTPLQACFHPEGDFLSIASNDFLQTWKLDTMECVDVKHVKWNQVKDITILSDEHKLIAASSDQNFVNVWGLNMDYLSEDEEKQIAIAPKSNFIVGNKNSITVLPPLGISSSETSRPAGSTNQLASLISTSEVPFIPQNDQDLIDALYSRHSSMLSILKNRATNVKLIKNSWDDGFSFGKNEGVKLCVEKMIEIHDSAIWVDILRILNLRPKLLGSLDICELLLPILGELLFEVYDDFLIVACTTIKILVKNFADVITTTIKSASFSPAVDISMEGRLSRCKACHKNFTEVGKTLGELQHSPAFVGIAVRDTLKELSILISK